MKVGFIRYHGQDSATVFVGDVLEAVRRDYDDDNLTQNDLLNLQANGELTIVEQEIIFDGLTRISVGHLL